MDAPGPHVLYLIKGATTNLSPAAQGTPSAQRLQVSDSPSNKPPSELVALRGNNRKRIEFKQLKVRGQGFYVPPGLPARQRACAESVANRLA